MNLPLPKDPMAWVIKAHLQKDYKLEKLCEEAHQEDEAMKTIPPEEWANTNDDAYKVEVFNE
tara:strand:- start:514 stop:699 length:186 start_codon:yes stop_codon:yes gene_type:complete